MSLIQQKNTCVEIPDPKIYTDHRFMLPFENHLIKFDETHSLKVI